MNYSHKNKDIDEALDICDYVMCKIRKTIKNIPAQKKARKG